MSACLDNVYVYLCSANYIDLCLLYNIESNIISNIINISIDDQTL